MFDGFGFSRRFNGAARDKGESSWLKHCLPNLKSVAALPLG